MREVRRTGRRAVGMDGLSGGVRLGEENRGTRYDNVCYDGLLG